MAKRGFAISFLTLTSVELLSSFLTFFCNMPPAWHQDVNPAVPFRTVAGDLVAAFERRRQCSVQIWTDSRLCVIAFCLHEKARTHVQTNILRHLSYMWSTNRKALCAAFRCSTFRSPCREEVCCCWSHRRKANSPSRRWVLTQSLVAPVRHRGQKSSVNATNQKVQVSSAPSRPRLFSAEGRQYWA